MATAWAVWAVCKDEVEEEKREKEIEDNLGLEDEDDYEVEEDDDFDDDDSNEEGIEIDDETLNKYKNMSKEELDAIKQNLDQMARDLLKDIQSKLKNF